MPAQPGRLRALLDAGVFGVKCFLPDSGVDGVPGADRGAACRRRARRWPALDGLLLVHAEDPERRPRRRRRPAPTTREFLASRPPDGRGPRDRGRHRRGPRTGARVHIVHLSSAGALPALAAAKADGVRVTVETCPHYLVLRAEDVPDGATAVQVLPAGPRRRQPRGALGRPGRRHDRPRRQRPLAVHRRPLKHLDTGDFGTAWGGISSLQLGLLAGVDRGAPARARPGRRDALDVGRRPPRWSGWPPRARSAVGGAADLVAFAPDDRAGRRPRDAAPPQRRDAVRRCAARPAWCARRGWLGRRSPRTEPGPPAGRLLARGEA